MLRIRDRDHIQEIRNVLVLETRVEPNLTQNALGIERRLENALHALDRNRMIGGFFNGRNYNAVGPTAKNFQKLIAALSLLLQVVKMDRGRPIGHG
jgi:hypothetical protein